MKLLTDAQRAFSLVEVTLALGVMAIGLVSIFGLLPTGLNSNQAATQQTATINLITAIQSDLRGTPATIDTSSLFALPLSRDSAVLYFTENGTLLPSKVNALYRATVYLKKPSAGVKTATTGRIVISWPAQQDDILKATGSTEAFIALNRN